MSQVVLTYSAGGNDAVADYHQPAWGEARTFILTFLLYVAGAGVGFALQLPARPHMGQIAVLWPPNPLLIGLLLVAPARRWWVILLAALLAHVLAQTLRGTPLWLVGVQFSHNVLLTLPPVYVIRRLYGPGPFHFDTLGRVIVFLLLAVVIAPPITAIFPAVLRVRAGLSPDVLPVWRQITISNALSIGILTPVMAFISTRLLRLGPVDVARPGRIVEGTILFAALGAISYLVFDWSAASLSTRTPALVYLPLPFLLWAALRFGPVGASFSLSVVAAFCIRGALAGSGPLAGGSPEENALSIQYFLLALCLPELCLAAIACERSSAIATALRCEGIAREQYAKLAAIYRTAPLGMAYIDTQLVFRGVNDFLANAHNLPIDQHIGRSLDQVLAPNVAETAKAVCRRVIETGIEDVNREISGRAGLNSTEHRAWLVSHFPVMDGGTVIGVNVILQDITDQKRALSEIEENHRALRESLDRAQDLSRRLIQVQEDERARIARELHDDVNQQLAVLSMAVGGLKRRMPAAAVMRRELESIQRRAIALTDDIRSLCHGLHSGVLEHVGLSAAIRAYCHETEQNHALEMNFSADDGIGAVRADLSLCLYRIAQEAITNVVRHAKAARVGVELRLRDGGLQLSIADDGRGFDTSSSAVCRGLGLISMEERIHMVQGRLELASQPGNGTTLRVWAPLQASDSQGVIAYEQANNIIR